MNLAGKPLNSEDYDALIYITDQPQWKTFLNCMERVTQYIEAEMIRAPLDADLKVLKGRQMGARALMNELKDLKQGLVVRED